MAPENDSVAVVETGAVSLDGLVLLLQCPNSNVLPVFSEHNLSSPLGQYMSLVPTQCSRKCATRHICTREESAGLVQGVVLTQGMPVKLDPHWLADVGTWRGLGKAGGRRKRPEGRWKEGEPVGGLAQGGWVGYSADPAIWSGPNPCTWLDQSCYGHLELCQWFQNILLP